MFSMGRSWSYLLKGDSLEHTVLCIVYIGIANISCVFFLLVDKTSDKICAYLESGTFVMK